MLSESETIAMQLTFLGTGTSKGVPEIGCTCHVCTSHDPRDHRLRTSALLQVDNQHIVIDVGPDFRTQALRAQLTRLDAVLITHHHFDHIAGIDDVRPFNGKHGTPLTVYGNQRALADIRFRFSYAFDGGSQGSTRPALVLKPINEKNTPFFIGNTRIIPFDVQHGTWTITGYRIGKLAYITDASHIPEDSLSLLHGLDVLVLNALRHKPHPTHFSLANALEAINIIRPKQTYLVHMTHSFHHETTQATLPPGVCLAHDGLTITIAD